jgi:hypothetical protein
MQPRAKLSPKFTNLSKGIKKRPVHRPLFAKRRKRKGNLSGKAMHDAVPACAKTHGLKKSQFLEEG